MVLFLVLILKQHLPLLRNYLLLPFASCCCCCWCWDNTACVSSALCKSPPTQVAGHSICQRKTRRIVAKRGHKLPETCDKLRPTQQTFSKRRVVRVSCRLRRSPDSCLLVIWYLAVFGQSVFSLCLVYGCPLSLAAFGKSGSRKWCCNRRHLQSSR